MDHIKFKSTDNAATVDRMIMERYRTGKIESWEAAMRMRMNNKLDKLSPEEFVALANSLGYRRKTE